nr:NERD domain-containing protein [Thioalkalivibrio sp. XN279]
MIPQITKDCPRSERLVFESLGRQLPDEWIVLHSLELSRHPLKMWGETDIVIISTKGLFVIEVKGGTVSCRDGEWTITSPNGRESYTKAESPWAQASGAAATIRNRLYDNERFRGCLVGYGVALPYETFTAESEEIIQEVLWDRRHRREDLALYVGRLARFWRERHEVTRERSPREIKKEDIQEIRRLLRPDVESHMSLGSYLNALHAELIELTATQAKILKGMKANPKTIVSGLAGTGKTLLAFDKAKYCAEECRKSVLYVCFNKLLARHITENIPESLRDLITVANLHSYYRSVISDAGNLELLSAAGGDERKLYGTVMPEAFADSVLELDLKPFDVLIVDEAQDILTPSHLDAIDVIVEGGIDFGEWHLFMDPKQDIYGELSTEALERLQDVGYASYELTVNCRNTRPVAVETSVIAGFECAIEGAIDGPACKTVTYRDTSDFEQKITQEVERLLERDLDPTDIIILSSRRKSGSLLRNMSRLAGQPIVDLTEDVPNGDHIAFCTIHAFKGLERKCVIAIDIQGLEDEAKALLHYAGLSRAQFLLTTFLQSDTKVEYERRLREFGARLVS